MMMGLIACLIPVRLRAIGTHLLAIWTQNSHIISVVSYGNGYPNRHHTGKCLGMRLICMYVYQCKNYLVEMTTSAWLLQFHAGFIEQVNSMIKGIPKHNYRPPYNSI